MHAPGPGVITLDLHGKNAFQARLSIDAALRRARGAYRLRVIHGHIRGDVLKALVRSEYAAHPQVLRIEAVNEGASDLVLREYSG